MLGNNTLVADRYEIRAVLMERGPYVTYSVRDVFLKRDAALRTFQGVPDPAAIERFARECEILTTLHHPSVIEVFDRGQLEDGGSKPFVIVALLPGLTLDQLIEAESRRLTPVRVAEFMSQVCRGVQAAHDEGIADGCVEAADILLMKDDSVKIVSFSPGPRNTAPDDVLRLGSICFEALALQKAERVPVLNLSLLNPEVSTPLALVVRRAIDPDPAKRFPTVREFGEALLGAVRGSTVNAGAPETSKAPEPSKIPERREAQTVLPPTPAPGTPAHGQFTQMFDLANLKAGFSAAAGPVPEPKPAPADIKWEPHPEATPLPSSAGEFTRFFKVDNAAYPPSEPAANGPAAKPPSGRLTDVIGSPAAGVKPDNEMKPKKVDEAAVPASPRPAPINRPATAYRPPPAQPADATRIFRPPQASNPAPGPSPRRVPEPFAAVPAPSPGSTPFSQSEPGEYSQIIKTPFLPAGPGQSAPADGTGIFSSKDRARHSPPPSPAGESDFSRVIKPSKPLTSPSVPSVQSLAPAKRSNRTAIFVVVVAVLLIVAVTLVLWVATSR